MTAISEISLGTRAGISGESVSKSHKQIPVGSLIKFCFSIVYRPTDAVTCIVTSHTVDYGKISLKLGEKPIREYHIYTVKDVADGKVYQIISDIDYIELLALV